jgi:predicted phage terminase large subunit-like protein
MIAVKKRKPAAPQVDLSDIQATAIALAKADFYSYCRIRMPKFYKADRTYLKDFCRTLQQFVDSELLDEHGEVIEKLMINLPPRHGKTLTLVMLAQWLLGHFPTISVIDVAYNETLSGRYAKYVRDGMQEEKANENALVYADFFPNSKIKQGDGAYQLWALEGSHFSFLATSPGGTLTGNGCQIGIIDDIIKNAVEAYNETLTEGHYGWYTNTFLSRLENGAKQLMVMHRWSVHDLCGRILKVEPEKWHVIKMRANKKYPEEPACDADMLCSTVLSKATYLDRKAKTDNMIFDGNYDQEPSDSIDKLYAEFKTYNASALPLFSSVESYTDTADEGSDFLCSISYGISSGFAYVLDVVFTQDSMESTEPLVARMLASRKVDRAYIESNNGGRGFARAVERIAREEGNSRTVFEWFHQAENKMARILSNATSVSNCILFPQGWRFMWPTFYAAVSSLGRQTKWLHDDAPDCLTGIMEKSLSLPTYIML